MPSVSAKETYLDYAAATPIDPVVLASVQLFLTTNFANPGSVHAKGEEVRLSLDAAREEITHLLHSHRVIFTSTGTESINLALQGVVKVLGKKGRHIISQPTEHHAVLRTLDYLKSQGFEVTLVPVDKEGIVCPADIAAAIRPDTILCTIMYVNNETGVIQPIKDIAKICHEKGVLFHTDACQAGLCNLDMKDLCVDLLSLDASKLCGPRGAGALCVGSFASVSCVQPILFGGDQEFGLRPGTENVAGIVGFVKALSIMQKEREEESKLLWNLHNTIMQGLTPMGAVLNGHATERIPHIINVSFPSVEAESLVLKLSDIGIFVSAGSACTSRTMKTSHVLQAMHLTPAKSHGSVRISFGRFTTTSDLKNCIAGFQSVLNHKLAQKTSRGAR